MGWEARSMRCWNRERFFSKSRSMRCWNWERFIPISRSMRCWNWERFIPKSRSIRCWNRERLFSKSRSIRCWNRNQDRPFSKARSQIEKISMTILVFLVWVVLGSLLRSKILKSRMLRTVFSLSVPIVPRASQPSFKVFTNLILLVTMYHVEGCVSDLIKYIFLIMITS